MKLQAPSLYDKYFIKKDDERLMLFEKLQDKYNLQSGIYPGSFVHISPSFYLPQMCYIDSDRRINSFFSQKTLLPYVESRKNYSEAPHIHYFQADYRTELPLATGYFDVLFSFYAGFISRDCKQYLKKGGILVCNNSHGDASLAYTEPDYKLIAVIKRKGNYFNLSENKLDNYFQKKDASPIDKKKVLEKMRGESFSKTAFAYVFRFMP